MEDIIRILPAELARYMKDITFENITEIRLRVGQKARIRCIEKEESIEFIVSKEHLQEILKRVSINSIYAIQNNINLGYITAPGGNRIGITGEVVEEAGMIKNIKNISSMNIRVAHEVRDCSKDVIYKIYNDGAVLNTLIISPPGKGKTTMLRDIVRKLSDMGKNVGVVDERYEIANVYLGLPTMDIGKRSDVMSGIAKAQGINFMVRSMGLDVIATDEIGDSDDCLAIKNASKCGVKIIATAHGSETQDLPYELQELVDKNVFDLLVYLSEKIGQIPKVVRVWGGKNGY